MRHDNEPGIIQLVNSILGAPTPSSVLLKAALIKVLAMSLSIRVEGETETVQTDILTDSAATDVDQPMIPSDWLGDARATGVARDDYIGE